MKDGEILLATLCGYVFVTVGGALAITQGSQYFWSQQYAHATHRGSALATGFGIAVVVIGIVWLSSAMKLRKLADKK
jgi:uncharacterized membrane protein YciS (DUF1049 family)